MTTHQQVVYLDVLFVINLIFNYFILLTVSKILHRRDIRLRMLSGAAIGAVYACLVFFPQLSFLYISVLKFVCSLAILAASYHVSSLRSFLKVLVCFYLVTAAFGGILFALWYFAAPSGMTLRNGVAYFDLSPLVLILGGSLCYIILTLLSRFLHRNVQTQARCRLRVTVGDLHIETPALLDTGNTLCDVLTGAPVVIAEYARVEKLLPKALQGSFKRGTLDYRQAAADSDWAGRVRMIPYSSVNAAGGLLPAFRPDEVQVTNGAHIVTTRAAIIAVSARRLSADGSYGALLSPHLFSEITAE